MWPPCKQYGWVIFEVVLRELGQMDKPSIATCEVTRDVSLHMNAFKMVDKYFVTLYNTIIPRMPINVRLIV